MMWHPGLFDLPAPLWAAIDAVLNWAHFPAPLRIALWGVLAGWMSMAIYRRASPQQRLRAMRTELASVRQALLRHEGEFAEMQSLIFKQLELSLRQLGLTLAPAVLGALPLLLLMPWLSNRFASIDPAIGAPTTVCVEPKQAAASLRWAAPIPQSESGCWAVPWPAATTPFALSDAQNITLLTLPVVSSEVARFSAFNWVIGNPSGYLPAEAKPDAIRIDLPAREFLPWGPSWLRGWEAVFFLAVFATSLALKRYWRLH